MDQREANRKAWSIAFRILARNEPEALGEDDDGGQLPEADYQRMLRAWEDVLDQAFRRSRKRRRR